MRDLVQRGLEGAAVLFMPRLLTLSKKRDARGRIVLNSKPLSRLRQLRLGTTQIDLTYHHAYPITYYIFTYNGRIPSWLSPTAVQ